ncbi:MAG: 2-C-methyl-D-erythritol 4-phosphate cytidylyltransferase [Acidimicrobiaceae bacterium]|nr:2-C-methyl-D-erythritol 4-phosphate cytidylyltransferase [Acidimicrobiaceae bacterium]
MEGVWSIVLAAGSGSRFGGNKQLAQLGDQRVVDWSVASARSCCEGVVLVVNPQTIGDSAIPQADIVVPGGLTRSESVRKGLAVLPQSAEIVVIHDAARPGATIQMYLSTIEAVLGGADGAVPGLPVTDTLKQVVDAPVGKKVEATVDRNTLMTIQTPQAFSRRMLEKAHADGGQATDDAGLVEAVGGIVMVVPGDPVASKITSPSDLIVVAQLMGLDS